ncbi:GGDEF domain-containing response regulator [Undibacterium flavidum]|uniref:diguanylate cyclase n=1 Tax=Undibacterium flavidum TaxID=2762297 RepID=A0ABR6Y655_9BURK|nr:diguanylate cyclase [Undibacterium flavidum]MBC3872102.1 diguanylate cyclase [Undibacterium flavidum]
MAFFKKQIIPQATVSDADKPTVLLVDDEPENLRVLSAILSPQFNLLQAHNGQEALALVQALPENRSLSLVISDQRMPELTGVQLCERLCDIAPDTLRIIVTGYIDIDAIVDSINRARLYQFVIKPYDRHDFELLVKRAVEAYGMKQELNDYIQNLESKVEQRTQDLAESHRRLQEAFSQLEFLSNTDRLTGLHNRHYLYSVISKDLALMKRANKYEEPRTDNANAFLSEHKHANSFNSSNNEQPEQLEQIEQIKHHNNLLFFMIDCDHFKQVNDHYGHDTGDLLLCAIANVLKQVFRESDYLIRWGGEEFISVVRFFPRQQAAELAERLRRAIEDMELVLSDGRVIKRTCSVGYAILPGTNKHHTEVDWQGVVKLADYAMYCAKNSGRNTWVGLNLCDNHQETLSATIQNNEIQMMISRGTIQVEAARNLEDLKW